MKKIWKRRYFFRCVHTCIYISHCLTLLCPWNAVNQQCFNKIIKLKKKVLPLQPEEPSPHLFHQAAFPQEASFHVWDSVTWQEDIFGIILRKPWTCSASNYRYFSTFAEFQPHNRCRPRYRWSWAFGLASLRSQQAWQTWEMRRMHLVKMLSEKGALWVITRLVTHTWQLFRALKDCAKTIPSLLVWTKANRLNSKRDSAFRFGRSGITGCDVDLNALKIKKKKPSRMFPDLPAHFRYNTLYRHRHIHTHAI